MYNKNLNEIIKREKELLKNEIITKKNIYMKKNKYQLSIYGKSISFSRIIKRVGIRSLLIIAFILGGSTNPFAKIKEEEDKEELLNNKVNDKDIIKNEKWLEEELFLEMPASFVAIKEFKKENGEDALNSILYMNEGIISYKSLLYYSKDWLVKYKNEIDKINKVESFC